MERIVGFIDFGFLKKAGCRPLAASARRLTPKPEGVVNWLRSFQPNDPNAFLRAYWYDGAFDPRHARHNAQRRYFDTIAATPGIQLRLGHLQELKPKWQHAVREALKSAGLDRAKFEEHFQFRPDLGQKGVDTRIALDLVRLAQRHAYDVGVLIAGDRDLAEPVRLAQDEGRRIIVAAPSQASVAIELKQLADEVIELTPTILRSMFDVVAASSPASTQTAPATIVENNRKS
ncbi:MAG TPA: NYN domain-containing protein [Solirubrobacteraceae bacterium]|jgi:uncharacterized LabA/DUF88 family protein|nr:NYN domain-containing protein [Solirubrobacteraceae bacterium]